MGSPHIVVLAFPAQSHVNGAMDISMKLAELGVSITFVCTEAYTEGAMKQGFKDHADATGKTANQQAWDLSQAHLGGLPIRLHSLQPVNGLSGETHSKLSDTVDNLHAVIEESESMASAVEALLDKLQLSDNGIACVVYDLLLWWVAWLGKRLAIPAYIFNPFSAALISYGIHALDFASEGRLPLRPDTDLSDKSNVFIIPGLPPLHASELPTTAWEPNPIGPFDFGLRCSESCLHGAAGLLINSVYELEKDVIDELRKKAPAMDIKTVGPLLPSSFLHGEMGGAEERCLEWLDEQPAASVLYVAFGTIACLSQEQAGELALGLEESRARFLWVVRAPAGAGAGDDDNDGSSLLPRGFEERTKGRGVVLRAMAPQHRILCHRAVGAFLTHCGWNSMMESLCRGVPMLCWPMFGDQQLNAKWVVEVAQAGKLLERGDDGIARKEEVASMVGAMLNGTETGLREAAARARERVCRAVLDPHGSSSSTLQAFVESLSHAQLK